MATHSSIPTWRISQTQKPGRLESIGSQRVRHDWCDLAHMHKHSHHGSFQFTNMPSTTLQNHWTGYLGILASSILKQFWSFCPLNKVPGISSYCFVKTTFHPTCIAMGMNCKGTKSHLGIFSTFMWFGKWLCLNGILRETDTPWWVKSQGWSVNKNTVTE